MVEKRTAKATGYDGVAKTLHWVIVLLLIAQYTIAWSMPDINPRTPPNTLIDFHFSIGVTILALAVLRLLWRWTHPVPLVTDDVPAWQNGAARATHFLLYFLLFLLPILGWVDSGFRALPVRFYELVTIPPVIAASRALAGRTGDIHTFVSYVLLAVIGLHVLAALYHYLVRRDGVLQRMLPSTR